jgi:hypothetical protein
MTETTQSGAFVPAVIEQSNDLDSAIKKEPLGGQHGSAIYEI